VAYRHRGPGPGHAELLRACGIPARQAEPLARYLDLVAAWNARVNLTGARSARERVERLVAPVLPMLAALLPGPLLDVGSGNGSPGLVVALFEPERPVTLLEPRTRRWAFLREAARAAGRPGVRVLRLRHDGYAGPPAPNVSLRALRLSPVALAPLVAPGGRLLLFHEPAPPLGPFRPEPWPGLVVLRAPVSRETGAAAEPSRELPA
jgi:16S rRNA (guanine527-N7)-methyltransferase